MPLESVVAVPVVRPDPSRNVLVPLLSVVTVPVMRPLASRMVVCCADAAVIVASVSAAMVSVFIASFSLLRECSVTGTRRCRKLRWTHGNSQPDGTRRVALNRVNRLRGPLARSSTRKCRLLPQGRPSEGLAAQEPPVGFPCLPRGLPRRATSLGGCAALPWVTS